MSVKLGEAVTTIENPTVIQLAALSLVYAAKANNNPTLLTGTLPEGWVPPTGVQLAQQYGSEPPAWVLESAPEIQFTPGMHTTNLVITRKAIT